MITEKLQDDEKGIRRAAELLQAGGIVAIPTETVYGLAGSATNEKAIFNIFKAKGRPQDNPLIVHICDRDMLSLVAKDIPPAAFGCAEKFWPGPLTMVLPSAGNIAPCVSAGLDTVAVRMPSDPVAREIIRVSGLPLAAPSANTSGRPSPTAASHVQHDLDGKIDAIVFSGECEVGVESTVISFCCQPPRLLRPGVVTLEQLKTVIPDIVLDKAVLAEPEKGARVSSPGMKYKHYAPATESYLVEGDSDSFADFVNAKKNCAAICFSEDLDKLKGKSLCYGDGKDEKTLAHSLFDALRQVDKLGVDKAYIHAPSKTGVGLAVYNRLLRAAAFRVITL